MRNKLGTPFQFNDLRNDIHETTSDKQFHCCFIHYIRTGTILEEITLEIDLFLLICAYMSREVDKWEINDNVIALLTF